MRPLFLFRRLLEKWRLAPPRNYHEKWRALVVEMSAALVEMLGGQRKAGRYEDAVPKARKSLARRFSAGSR
jgi:hypothetical protein